MQYESQLYIVMGNAHRCRRESYLNQIIFFRTQCNMDIMARWVQYEGNHMAH